VLLHALFKNPGRVVMNIQIERKQIIMLVLSIARPDNSVMWPDTMNAIALPNKSHHEC
jgi:hypothetical protein